MSNEWKIGIAFFGDRESLDELGRRFELGGWTRWNEGDSVQGLALKRQNSGIEFSIKFHEELDLEAGIWQARQKAHPTLEELVRTATELGMNIGLRCAYFLETSSPIIDLSPNLIEFLAHIGASIDIDIIPIEED